MECPYCGKTAEWCENKKVYGKNYGKSYMCYYCGRCGSYVGCHNNTKRPLGTMAKKNLRRKRINAHNAIDIVWKTGKMTRTDVYKLLKNYFEKEIHIGESNIKECEKIINFAEKLKRQFFS